MEDTLEYQSVVEATDTLTTRKSCAGLILKPGTGILRNSIIPPALTYIQPENPLTSNGIVDHVICSLPIRSSSFSPTQSLHEGY